MSLFDEAGNVYRLLGKAEDVTGRRAAAEHFRQLAARHRRQARACLASARLDLTAGQTLDAKAASRHLLRTASIKRCCSTVSVISKIVRNISSSSGSPVLMLSINCCCNPLHLPAVYLIKSFRIVTQTIQIILYNTFFLVILHPPVILRISAAQAL